MLGLCWMVLPLLDLCGVLHTNELTTRSAASIVSQRRRRSRNLPSPLGLSLAKVSTRAVLHLPPYNTLLRPAPKLVCKGTNTSRLRNLHVLAGTPDF
jgi:hypothetical protein